MLASPETASKALVWCDPDSLTLHWDESVMARYIFVLPDSQDIKGKGSFNYIMLTWPRTSESMLSHAKDYWDRLKRDYPEKTWSSFELSFVVCPSIDLDMLLKDGEHVTREVQRRDIPCDERLRVTMHVDTSKFDVEEPANRDVKNGHRTSFITSLFRGIRSPLTLLTGKRQNGHTPENTAAKPTEATRPTVQNDPAPAVVEKTEQPIHAVAPTPTEQSITITAKHEKKEHGIMKEQKQDEPTGPTAPVTAPAVPTTTSYEVKLQDGKLILSELPPGAVIDILLGIDNSMHPPGPVIPISPVVASEHVPEHGKIGLDLGAVLNDLRPRMFAGHPNAGKDYSLIVLPRNAGGTNFKSTSLPISGEELAKLLAPPTGDTTVVITPPPTPLATIGPKQAEGLPTEAPVTTPPTPPAPTAPVVGTAPVTPPATTAPTAPIGKMVPEKIRSEIRNELDRVLRNITRSLKNHEVQPHELKEDHSDTMKLQSRLNGLSSQFSDDTATLKEFTDRLAEIQKRLTAEKKKFDDAEVLRKSAAEQSARLATVLAEKNALEEQNTRQAKELEKQKEALATAQAQAAAAAKAPSPAPAPTPATSSINNPPPPDKPPGDGGKGGSGDGSKDKNSKGDADKGKGNSSSLINSLLIIAVTASVMVLLFLFARNNNWLSKMDSSPTAAEKAKLEEEKLALQAEKARLGSEWTNIMGMHIATTNKINELDARVALIKSLQATGQVAGLVVPTAPPGSFQAIGWTNVNNGNNTNSIVIIGNGNIVIQPTNTVVIPQTPPHACKAKGSCTSCTDDGDDDWLQSIPKNASVNADGTRSWEVTLRPGMRCDYRVDPRRCEIVYKYNYRVNRQNIDDVEFYEINMQGIPVRIKLGDPNHSTPPEGVLGHSYIVGPRVVGEVHLQFTARRI